MKKQEISHSHLRVTQMILEKELDYLEVGGPGLLVTGCQHGKHALTLTIWSIDSPEQITYKCQLDFTGIGEDVSIDLNYISVVVEEPHIQATTIHFISTSTFTYKCQLDFTGEGKRVYTDLNYIFVSIENWQDQQQPDTIHFISTKTLEIERSLSTRGYKPAFYLDGILVLSNEDDCFW
jgi:hypothetical protein